MRTFHDSRYKKLAAGIFAVLMLVIVLFASFYITVESGHVCTGEDCPVCVCIQQCENTLHQIGNGEIAQIAVLLPVFISFFTACLSVCELSPETPVSDKVRLNR